MTKQDFIEMLRVSLNGKVSPGQVTENMRYYEDYINVEIRKGRSEEEVLGSLGDPRLIARTIVETGGGKGGGREYGGGQYGGEYAPEGGSRYGDRGEEAYNIRGRRGRELPRLLLRMPLWVWLALILLVVVLVLGVVFSVITALLPILLPLFGLLLLWKLFRDWKG